MELTTTIAREALKFSSDQPFLISLLLLVSQSLEGLFENMKVLI